MTTTATVGRPAPGTLAEAARLARRGQHDAARHLLVEAGGRDSDDVATLDLLARVYAQSGDLTAADACWARVELLDAEHMGARSGRRRIKAIWSERYRPRGARAGGGAALVVVLVACGVVVGSAVTPQHHSADQKILTELRKSRADQRRTGREVRSLRSGVDRAVNRPRRTTRAVAADLSGLHRTVRVERHAVYVSFRTRLFAHGAELSPAGRGAVLDAARQLRDVDGDDVAVTVVGYTDNVPMPPGSRYADNVELGLARAGAAAQAVSTGSGMPLGAVAVSSGGSAGAPFPNTTAEGRRKNQTVTLVVRPA